MLQGMIERQTEIERCYRMEINVEKNYCNGLKRTTISSAYN
jgi:hypothetical protein